MAFIDIFNFKKYFSKPSDSQVARYGHVNAAYDDLYNQFAGGSVIKYHETITVENLNNPGISYLSAGIDYTKTNRFIIDVVYNGSGGSFSWNTTLALAFLNYNIGISLDETSTQTYTGSVAVILPDSSLISFVPNTSIQVLSTGTISFKFKPASSGTLTIPDQTIFRLTLDISPL